ncbi:MAG: hypothetical protein MHMPM18_004516, partial [Marteilia pararefringens]
MSRSAASLAIKHLDFTNGVASSRTAAAAANSHLNRIHNTQQRQRRSSDLFSAQLAKLGARSSPAAAIDHNIRDKLAYKVLLMSTLEFYTVFRIYDELLGKEIFWPTIIVFGVDPTIEGRIWNFRLNAILGLHGDNCINFIMRLLIVDKFLNHWFSTMA